MKQIQFSHANGFPGSSYNYLFSLLPDYHITYIEKMGHGDYPLNSDLTNYAAELIADIEAQHNEPIIGMGHSAGAVVTLIAASLRPDLFKHVILLDPVLFSKRKRYPLKIAKKMGFIDKITPAARASKRRTRFPSREAAALYFRNKALFKHFHPRCFNDYITYGLTETEQGVELTISPEVEADVFRNVPLEAPKRLRQVKGTVIYGDKSNLFQKSEKNWWSRRFPAMELISIDGGHLFPFEDPAGTALLLNKVLHSQYC
ncbi:alpha/beta hydrolase [Neptuniibacter pectenicola]|uniref:Alpha/beta hydrolase n=1 Tax=Neptuniibacter pectenicola TaxID=1806669 RepID=A0ABU9TVN3_9GAMM